MPGSAALLLLATAVAGWRHDGSAVAPGPPPPTAWSSATDAAWQVALDAWSNASPVVLGDQLCVTSEPVRLTCFALDDGALRWSRDFPVIDALPDADRARLGPELEAATRAQASLPELQREASRLAREARRGDAQAEATLETVTAELLAAQATERAASTYLTPPVREQIGYATSTPAVDGDTLFALFGNGVVAAVAADGAVRWQRWLGPLETRTRGYGVGHGASPLVVDGVLVVPWQQLHGLDPKTGATRWQGPAHVDYGTPAVARLGGVGHLVTPEAVVVRAKDGAVVGGAAEPLYWSSPTVFGGSVLLAGGAGKAHGPGTTTVARRLDLARGADGAVTVTEAWRVSLPSEERVYASPSVCGGRGLVVRDDGELFVLDLDTGATVQQLALSTAGAYLPSPICVGARAWFGNEAGVTTTLEIDGGARVIAESRSAGFRATPLFLPGRVALRTLDGVVVFGR